LKAAFPNLPSVDSPKFSPSVEDLNPNWIVGFTKGDGSFTLGFRNRKDFSLGATCFPLWKITQHKRDIILLECIKTSLDCGSISDVGRDSFDLTVYGLLTITDKVIPFFTDYQFHGAKALDFRDFCKGIDIMNQRGH